MTWKQSRSMLIVACTYPDVILSDHILNVRDFSEPC
jgi:hypothetical protein